MIKEKSLIYSEFHIKTLRNSRLLIQFLIASLDQFNFKY